MKEEWQHTHEYIQNYPDFKPLCKHCGLLKSTIESGEPSRIINKDVDGENRKIRISPDSWEKEFDKEFTESTFAFGIGRNGRNKIKSFISQLLAKAKDEAIKRYAELVKEDCGINTKIGSEIGQILADFESSGNEHNAVKNIFELLANRTREVIDKMEKMTYDLSLETGIHSRDLMNLVKKKLKDKYDCN